MNRLQQRLRIIFPIIVLCGLGSQTLAWAQGGDSWSFVITPQVWAAHIAQNGFVSQKSPGGFFLLDDAGYNIEPILKSSSSPVDALNPQWGIQVAAQKGRWTLAGSYQYVTFETRTDLTYSPPNGVAPRPCFGTVCINAGDRYAQEFVNTTRMDMDFSVSYFFPDVVKDRLDLSLGGGLKLIYASASREYGNQSPFAVVVNAIPVNDTTGGYAICKQDNCSDLGFRDRVKTKDWLYGATIPVSAILHLTSDAKWLLPLSITPFVGAETRDDQDIVYKFDNNQRGDPATGVIFANPAARRTDGTTFAYGVTADTTIRYIVNETLSLYGGMRVQYIKGHEAYLAYGPMVGMSVRFGGK